MPLALTPSRLEAKGLAPVEISSIQPPVLWQWLPPCTVAALRLPLIDILLCWVASDQSVG